MVLRRVSVRRLGLASYGFMLGDLLTFVDDCERSGLPIDTPIGAMIGIHPPEEIKITGLVARKVIDVSPTP